MPCSINFHEKTDWTNDALSPDSPKAVALCGCKVLLNTGFFFAEPPIRARKRKTHRFESAALLLSSTGFGHGIGVLGQLAHLLESLPVLVVIAVFRARRFRFDDCSLFGINHLCTILARRSFGWGKRLANKKRHDELRVRTQWLLRAVGASKSQLKKVPRQDDYTTGPILK